MAITMGFTIGPPAGHEIPLDPMWVHCSACGHEWAVCAVPADADVVVKAIKAFGKCRMCRTKTGKTLMNRRPRKMTNADPLTWLLYSFDTGTSSEAMYYAITGMPPRTRSGGWGEWRPGVPNDPGDFGRCYRLLKAMEPHDWRGKWLHKVPEAFPEWAPFIAAWDELTALYEEEMGEGADLSDPQTKGTCPKLYDRLKALAQDASDAAKGAQS